MLSDLWYRLRFLLRRNRAEEELTEELTFHLEHEAEKWRRRGYSAEEAVRNARLSLGGAEQVKEQIRESSGIAGLHSVWRDIRYAIRSLRRSPAFTATAVLTIALGVGTNALIFSVVNAIFLRPLSYPDAGRIVWVSQFVPKFNRSMVLAPDYDTWRRSTAFERIEAMNTFGANLTIAGRPAERIQAARVTPGFFAMTGIRPKLGTGFDPDSVPSEPLVAVLSDSLWRDYFNADPGVVGTLVNLDGKPATVVGIMPRGFLYPENPDVGMWLPDAVLPAATLPSRNPERVRVIGRLKS